VDSVADKLIEKGVLKMSERESIVGNKSQREQIQGISQTNQYEIKCM
jgi:hypothetical protein